MITSKADRDALRQQHALTVPEPWEAHWDGTLGRNVVYAKETRSTPAKLVISIQRACYGNVPPEAEFIIQAHRLVPGLLDTIERYESAYGDPPSDAELEEDRRDREETDAMSDEEIRVSLEAAGINIEESLASTKAMIRVALERNALKRENDVLREELRALRVLSAILGAP